VSRVAGLLGVVASVVSLVAAAMPRELPPAQPAAFVYASSTEPARQYAHPGGLVVAGRDNYAAPAFAQVSEGGGTVLVYLDPMIQNNYGHYHQLMFDASDCGPAVPDWPGSPRNEWGVLSDIRVGGVLQAKLGCVMERMVAENPHMAGWFLDDLGSRPYGVPFETWSPADQQAYYDGAVAISRTAREVANRHGLMFLVNGSWTGGTLGTTGGGYPNVALDGNALADGGSIEYHDGKQEFFRKYACSSQWAAQAGGTVGRSVMLSISRSEADRDAYAKTDCIAYATAQTDYGVVPAPWGPFHDIGLPSRVAR
jgi:hypothetical protein